MTSLEFMGAKGFIEKKINFEPSYQELGGDCTSKQHCISHRLT